MRRTIRSQPITLVIIGLLLLSACGSETANPNDAQPSPTMSSSTALPTTVPTSGPTPTSPSASVPATRGTTTPTTPSESSTWGTTTTKRTSTSGRTGTTTAGSTRPSGGRSTTTTRTPTRGGTTTTQVVVPVITFADHRVEYRRHSVDLGARISPSGPIQYKVLYGGPGTSKDAQCNIVDGRLKLWNEKVQPQDRDRVPPGLPAACLIEASAPASAGRAAAVPRRALIDIRPPNFEISVDPIGTVSWPEHQQVTVRIHEATGAAFLVAVDRDYAATPADEPNRCGGGRAPVSGYSAPDTHNYEVTLHLDNPNGTPYTCHLLARGGPTDIQGFSKPTAFAITVTS